MAAEIWIPMHSLKCLYEMDQFGKIRNIKTKRILRHTKAGNIECVAVWLNGKSCSRSIQKLLWETHGKLPKFKPRGVAKAAVTVLNLPEIYYFSSFKQAAIFLSSRVFYSVRTLEGYFKKRKTEIKGWKIIYHEGDNV